MTAYIATGTHHGLNSVWQFASLIAIFALFKCAAMDLAPLQRIVNDGIRECLTLARITHQEAATLTGMSETNFYRALSGEESRNLSLVHLFKLPYRFWLHFGPMLMWLVAKKHAQEIRESFQSVRSAE